MTIPAPDRLRPAGALDEPLLLECCQRGDFVRGADVLRLGPLVHDPSSPAAPADRHALAQMQWARLDRMPSGVAAADPLLSAALSALSTAATGIAVAVTCEAGEVGVHLGIGGDADAWSSIRRMLAPGYLLTEDGAVPALGGAWDSTRPQAAFLTRLTPSHRSGSPRDADAAPATLLHRLLSLHGEGWGVVLHLEPLGNQAANDHVAALRRAGSAAEPHLSVTDQLDELRSASRTNHEGERIRDWIGLLASHCDEARASGAWRMRMHAWAASGPELAMVVGAVRGRSARPMNGDGFWQIETIPVGDRGVEAPAIISSEEFAELLRAPASSMTGLEVTPAMPATRISANHASPLRLGTWLGVDDPAAIDVSDLEGHAFISGVTGSGKSTTIARLLLGLWNAHRIPFLVIDPVKAEYASLASVMGDELQVVSARDLALNVLEPFPGADHVTHLGAVSTIFRGSFSMPSPTPYVLQQVLDEMTDRVGHAPTPTLHDLRADIAALVPELGYRGEIQDNIQASLGTRLAVLTSPLRAERLAAAGNSVLPTLFDRPTVIHLTELGDDEERAFITGMLMLYVAQAARVRGITPGIAHVTAVEEAHRILPEPSSGGGEESGDPASVTARFMTQLLAEIRSYGESLLIVDQSPAAVARDVLRNTNTKIVHRVVDPEDRDVLAGSIGLPPEDAPVIGRLAVGQALIATRALSQPQALQVQYTRLSGTGRAASVQGQPRRPCCEDPMGHHAAERSGGEASGALLRALISEGASASQALTSVAARNPGAPMACLGWVGLRRALWTYARLGHVQYDEVAGLLDEGFRELMARGSVFTLAATLHAHSRQAGRPFEGCRSCPAPCEARPFVVGALGRRLVTAADDVRRIQPGNELGALAMAVGLTVTDVQADLGAAQTGAVAQCITGHVAHAVGLPASLTLADVREAGRGHG